MYIAALYYTFPTSRESVHTLRMRMMMGEMDGVGAMSAYVREMMSRTTEPATTL